MRECQSHNDATVCAECHSARVSKLVAEMDAHLLQNNELRNALARMVEESSPLLGFDEKCACTKTDPCGYHEAEEIAKRLLSSTAKRNDATKCFLCGAEAVGKIGAEPRCEAHV